jgi:hypothetical protein
MPEHHVGQGVKATRKSLNKRKTIGVCPKRGLACYASRQAARKAVKSILAQGRGNTIEALYPGRGLHEYQCQTCNHWHIGH